jgi:hypothetical protein
MKTFSIIFIAMAFIVAACEKEKAPTTYTGPDLVEFNPISKTVTTTTAPKRDSILVQLVGPLRASATKVNFEIDPTSTAVAADYQLLTPTVEIPANSSSTWVKFLLNKVTTTKTLKVNLTGGDNVQASANYKSFTYSLK